MKREEYKGEYDVFETPDHLWSNIETALDEPKRKKRRLFIWVPSAAAVLVLAIVLVNSFNATVESPHNNIVAQDTGYVNPLLETSEQEPSKRNKNQIDEFDRMNSNTQGAARDQEQQITTTATDAMASYDVDAAAYAYDVSANVNCGTTPLSSMGPNTYGWSSFGAQTKSGDVSFFASERRQILSAASFDGWTYKIDLDEIETFHGSTYDQINENKFISVAEEDQSTFSIDVDGASYSDVRGMINRNVLPNPNAVRLEEFINYFPYNYSEPKGDHPFSMHSEVVDCPWNGEHKLMKIGIKGESIDSRELPRNNIVFLLDVSGSMMSSDKLDLIKKGFNLLVQEMREQDRVSICVYAGAAGLVLPPTSGAHKDKIMDAINRLEAGGSTAGGQGIELAYATAEEYFDPNGNNRIILATDGDFNVGISDDNSLVELIEKKRKTGVFLTVLGVGHDNFQSSKMEKLANNGNGNFSYIDNILEAKKVLVTEMGGTLKTIAKDVKIQVDFNPDNVESYRLIGYENRLLNNEDFENDAIDAGELGAGHTVTAVYEIVPKGSSVKSTSSSKDNAMKTVVQKTTTKFKQGEFAVLKFRYKEPNGNTSKLIQTTISNSNKPASTDMKFIQSVIEFGLILRDSEYKGNANFDRVLKNAKIGLGRDPYGYRSEFIKIVEKTKTLKEGSNTN